MNNSSPLDNLVKCTECLCLLDKYDAQVIIKKASYQSIQQGKPLFYCKRCKPNYDVVNVGDYGGTSFSKIVPQREAECNSLGEVYGEIKTEKPTEDSGWFGFYIFGAICGAIITGLIVQVIKLI